MQTLFEVVRRCVSEPLLRLLDVRQGMKNIAWPKIVMDGLPRLQFRKPPSQDTLQQLEQLGERCLLTQANVINLIKCIRILRGRCKQVRLNDIFDKTKIATGFASSMYPNRLLTQQRRQPFRYHGRISAFRVLARAEHVEIT